MAASPSSAFALLLVASMFLGIAAHGISGTNVSSNWTHGNPPGELYVQKSEDYLRIFHEKVILEKELDRNLRLPYRLEISHNVSTSLSTSTIFIRLMSMALIEYHVPEMKQFSVTASRGIVLKVVMPTMSFEGRYQLTEMAGHWPHKNSSGNVTMTLTGTSLTLQRELVRQSNGAQMRWNSFNCRANIGDLRLLFDNPTAKALIKQINVSAEVMTFQQNLCLLPRYLIDTRQVEQVRRISDSFYLNTSLLRPPVINDHSVQFDHAGVARYKDDEERFTLESSPSPPPPPPMNQSKSASKTSVYRLPQSLFNSFAYFAHKHALISCSYTKDDLSAAQKQSLDTHCAGECVGKLFPLTSSDFPNSSIEIDISATDRPVVRISPIEIKANIPLSVTVSARSKDPSSAKTFLFSLSLFWSPSVTLRIKRHRLHLYLSRPELSFIVAESRVNDSFDNSTLTKLVSPALYKLMNPFVQRCQVKGIRLFSESLCVDRYETSLGEGFVSLAMDLKNEKTKKKKKKLISLKTAYGKPIQENCRWPVYVKPWYYPL